MNRIEFLKAESEIDLSLFLQNELKISSEKAYFLIDIGAIYVNSIRLTSSILLKTGDIIRCHKEPRRFNVPKDISKQIIFECEDFLIINKPAGLPTQANLDNRIENLHYSLSQTIKKNIFITHRLDQGTQGLILFAKTKNFQTYFNQLLSQHQVVKIYQAITTGPLLSPGLLDHWMEPHPRSPKKLSSINVSQWKHCQMQLLDASILNESSCLNIININGKRLQNINIPHSLNQYRIQLYTGRTHQIRAQLTFEKNPILGDTLYGGIELLQDPNQNPTKSDFFLLQCERLEFTYKGETFCFQLKELSSWD